MKSGKLRALIEKYGFVVLGMLVFTIGMGLMLTKAILLRDPIMIAIVVVALLVLIAFLLQMRRIQRNYDRLAEHYRKKE